MFPISNKESQIRQFLLKYKRPLLYVTVGGLNSGVDFTVFHLLYFITPLPAPACQAISYTMGVGNSFLLNRGLTFRDGAESRIARQAGRFILVNFTSWLVGVTMIFLLTSAGIHTTVAKVMTTSVTAVLNYLGYKRFVFRVGGK